MTRALIVNNFFFLLILQTQNKVLSTWLTIASSLHDIVHFLCAHSRLGSIGKSRDQNNTYSIAADWGGAEGGLFLNFNIFIMLISYFSWYFPHAFS